MKRKHWPTNPRKPVKLSDEFSTIACTDCHNQFSPKTLARTIDGYICRSCLIDAISL